MGCTRVSFQMSDGARATGFVCTGRTRARRCLFCGHKPADLLCDWKVPGKKSGTCDRPMCLQCSTKPAEGKDLCPTHATAWKAWLKERGIKDGDGAAVR